MRNNERIYGIDILRILAMFFVVLIHILHHGGGVSSDLSNFPMFLTSNSMLAIVWCGVDVFAIISGYVGYLSSKKSRAGSFIKLWLQVVVYSFGISILIKMVLPDQIKWIVVLNCLFPFTNRVYWYFTSYVFVIAISPAINACVEKGSTKQHSVYIITGLIALYLSHFLEGLFSICLLIYLYYLGAILKKYNVQNKYKVKYLVTFLLTLNLINITSKVVLSSVNNSLSGVLIRYDSPTIILISIVYVLLFSKIKIHYVMCKKIIDFIKPSVFSIYLINDHFLLRGVFVSDKYSSALNKNTIIYLLIILISGVIWCFVSICIDSIRRYLFFLAKCDSKCDTITLYYNRICCKIIEKMNIF